jgi:hypothetical protein
LQDGKASRHTLVFLQGFCVKRPSWYDLDHVNVVHLDPQQFAARLPDRDILIDADQQLARVEAEMRSAWQKALEDAKARLEPREFVDTYFEAMQQWGLLALLNDMDEVPADVFAQIVGYPILAPSEERDYVKTVSTAPSRSDIECGRVMLVSPEWPNTENIGHWMLARHKQWLVTHAYLLDAGHWLRKHVRYIDDETLQIEAESETARATLEGRWAQPLVIMCRSVRIRMGDHQVEIVNEAVCRDGDLLVPEGEESGRAVRQLCDFCEEDDRYRDDDMQADSDTLADLILRLRYTDPVSTLNSLLTDLRLGKYPLLHGRQFAVCVGVGGMPGFSVEMLDGGTAEPSSGGVRHAGR